MLSGLHDTCCQQRNCVASPCRPGGCAHQPITWPRWPPKIINLISAGLFLVLTLIVFLGDRSIDGWLFDWASGLVTLALGLLLFATMPFTEQYTRERVPREYWGRPIFKKVNRVLILAWAGAS